MAGPSDNARMPEGRAPAVSPRRFAEAAIPVAAVLVTVALPILYRDRLPDPVAIHWGPGGAPDGSASLLADAALMTGMTALLAGGPFLALRSAPRTMARFLIASAWSMAVLFAGLRWATLEANAGAAHWTQAGALGWSQSGPVIIVSGVAAVLGWLLAGDRPDRSMPRTAVAAAPLEPGRMVLWHGVLTSRIGQIVPVVVILAAGVLWLMMPQPEVWIAMVSLASVLVASSVLSKVAVTVGPEGMVVRVGYLGWPRVAVPVGQVEGVTVEEVEPMAYGGWGYRKVPGATAIVLRKGPALRIQRRGQGDLVVTIDEPEQAGSILLAHRQAAGDPNEG